MNDQSNCPPKQTLIDFLLGKLEPSQVATCEQHLNDCKPCGDTIRGLDANDTFVGLASNSNPSLTDADSNEESDQLVVKMLIDKMQGMQPTLSSSGKQTTSAPSRADEIINLLQPTVGSDSMGRLAHYEIHELLGVGATSVVFRARDEQLHRDVALKVLRPSLGDGARERFLAEARAAAALNHENITTIYQVATEDHLAYMAQQWLPGETLEARLEREPELDIEEIKSFSLQVANGLAAAHAKNLIHRDIKPANIWIDSERNRAIILDFGLVRVADDQPQLTETGMIAGTPNYMSPEQTRGSEVDSRSDLFSLGCVMYRMCTGRLPFQAGNTLATLQAIQNDTTPPPRHLNTRIPAELSELVLMLLSKDFEGRPRTAGQVASALQDATVMTELLAHRRENLVSAERQKSPPRRSWWLWGAAATLLFALMLLSGPQIVRIVTNHGVLEIESNDPDVAVEVLQGGEVVYVVDEKTDQRLEIAAGSYKIQPAGDGNSFELSQDTLTMKRGGKVVVTVTKSANIEPDQAPRIPALSDKDYASPMTDSGESTHQLATQDLKSRIETSQEQLGKLTADKNRIAVALEAGPKQVHELLWELLSSGAADVDPDEVDKNRGIVDNINQEMMTLEIELNTLKLRMSPDHPQVREIQSRISIWKEYLAGVTGNGVDSEALLQRYLKMIDQQIANLSVAMEEDIAKLIAQIKKSDSNQATALVQRAKKRYEQVVNRIKHVELEREMAEATLDWGSTISATETLVEIYKTLVAESIDLRELGEMTPAQVDAVKQNLLHEDSKLSKLRQSRHSRLPVIELEQLYAIALEKFDKLELQYKAGKLQGQDFWPSQLALFEAEVNLHEARGHHDEALRSLGRIVETRKTIFDSVVLRRESGLPSEIGFVEAKIGLENAKARYRDVSRKYNLSGDLEYYLKSDQGSPSNDIETKNSDDSDELTYDGRTFEQWLSILETERSPERLKTALDAIQQLCRESDGQKVVDAIMRLARIHGQQGVFFDLNDKAIGIFNKVPPEIVVDAFLRELKVPNQYIGNFMTQFPLWFRVWDPKTNKMSPDPEFAALLADRSDLLQNLLFKIIDTELDPELASEGGEHLEWSVSLLVNLLTQFEFFQPNDQEALIERISQSVPRIQRVDNRVWLVGYLAKAGVDVSRFEDLLLQVLIPSDIAAGLGFPRVSPYISLVLKTLNEMGPGNTGQKTIDAVTKILSDDKYWKGSGFAAPQPDKNKILAIELLGSFGEKAVSALPVLKKIAETTGDQYVKSAIKAIIQIEVPKHAIDDALKMQGRWKLKTSDGGQDDESKNDPMMILEFRGFEVSECKLIKAKDGGSGASIGARGGAGLPDNDSSYLKKYSTGKLEFTNNAGEINLFESRSQVPIKGIYELNGDTMKLCLARNAESGRPTSFGSTKAKELIILKRVK